MDTLDTVFARIGTLMSEHRRSRNHYTPEGYQAYMEAREALIIECGWDPTSFDEALEARLQEIKAKIDIRARILAQRARDDS